MANSSTSFGRFLKSSKRKRKLRIEEMYQENKVFFPSAFDSHEEDAIIVYTQIVDELSLTKKGKTRSARKK